MGSDQVQISRWQATQCDDMSTIHEEADLSLLVHMLVCYGKSNCESLTKARHMMWIIKLVRVKLPQLVLCSLPQASDSFRQNTLRAHLQMTIWLNSLESHPPDLDSTSYGFLRMNDQTYLTRRL